MFATTNYFFFEKRLFSVIYSRAPNEAQRTIPIKGDTEAVSIAPIEPKNPKKLIAHNTVFSILIAAVLVKNATIVQIADMILSLM